MSDVPLFDLPKQAPLPRPVTRLEGAGPISYAKYAPKYPARCQDCDQVSLEANRAGRNAPLARQARFKRTQGSFKLLLCVEHKQAREEAELREAVQAELRAHGGP